MSVITLKLRGSVYVLDSCHTPKTYGLGRVQRDILDYLATAPAGFGGPLVRAANGDLTKHGPPYGVLIADIAESVYSGKPTVPQTRAVQRAVRRLEQLGHVDCWHGWTGRLERRYTTALGFDGNVPVSALYIAARWECEHLERGAGGRAEDVQLDADNPVQALQQALGGWSR